MSPTQLPLKTHVRHTALSLGVLLLFTVLTRPEHLPAVFFIVPFVLLFVALMSLSGLLSALYSRYGSAKRPRGHRYLRATVSGTLVLLLVLQSLGQLTLRDIATVVGIAVIGYLYIGRSRFGLKNR